MRNSLRGISTQWKCNYRGHWQILLLQIHNHRKHSPSDDPTFTGKGIIGEASEEVVAEFHSDGSSSSEGTSSDDSDFCENKELVFEVDVKDTSRQVEPHFSPPLHRIDPHHIGEKLGGQLETYDSDPEGNEEHDDQVGEPSSPSI